MPVKQISEKDLTRMKKRGGVKVKRKLGTATKKPEPEIKEEGLDLSGSDSTNLPTAPASPVPDTKPYAAMSASIAASNASMEKLVDNNTQAIRDFGVKLAALKPAEKSIWQKSDFIRHKVKRGKDKLIEYVDSTPMLNRR
jgi:hypothetical protein